MSTTDRWMWEQPLRHDVKLILITVQHLTGPTGTTHASTSRIASLCSLPTETVERALNHLADLRLLTIERPTAGPRHLRIQQPKDQNMDKR